MASKHLGLLKAAAGQISLHSMHGRFLMKVAPADSEPFINGALSSLMSIGGEVSLHGSYGRYLQRLARLDERPGTAPNEIGGEVQVQSPLGAALTNTSRRICPGHVPNSPLDGMSIQAPAVIVNQDSFGMQQEEPSVAVDPTNPSRIVVAMITAETAAWDCKFNGAPCSAVFGTQTLTAYVSVNGGQSWCCASSSPSHPGGLLPGLVLATGSNTYNATFDPSVAFDSAGNVYVGGEALEVDLADPNIPPSASAISVNRGVPSGSTYAFAPAVFLNETGLPFINDKPWLAVDSNPLSAFADQVYVAWSLINLAGGPIPTSSIVFSFSSDGGQTFSAPADISGLVAFSTGARPFVAPNGNVFVVFAGTPDPTTTLPSIWIVKSTNGGATFGLPVSIADVVTELSPHDTIFRAANSPAAAAAPNGDLYVTWVLEVDNAAVTYEGQPGCEVNIVGEDVVRANCHSVAVYSKSVDGGGTWSAPALVFTPATRTAEGYPVTNPDGTVLSAPAGIPVDDVMPAIAISSAGTVYISAYRSTIVSPWQSCAQSAQPEVPLADVDCITLGNYIDNGRMEYFVKAIGGATQKLSTHPINSRYGFAGTFFGDYTDIAVGSDGTFHAVWCDTNSVKPVHWLGPFELSPGCTHVHNQEIATRSGT